MLVAIPHALQGHVMECRAGMPYRTAELRTVLFYKPVFISVAMWLGFCVHTFLALL